MFTVWTKFLKCIVPWVR